MRQFSITNNFTRLALVLLPTFMAGSHLDASEIGKSPKDRTSEVLLHEEATKIIQNFGKDGRLEKTGLQSYLAEKEFSKIDTEKNNQLSFEEWHAAYLYCTPDRAIGEVCPEKSEAIYNEFDKQTIAAKAENKDAKPQTNTDQTETENSKSIRGVLNEKTLVKFNNLWGGYIEAQTNAHWAEVNAGPSETWGLSEVVDYLRIKAEQAANRLQVKDRVQNFKSSANDGDVTKDTFEMFRRREIFVAADSDYSGDLDLYEAKAAFPIDDFLRAYLQLGGNDLRVDVNDYSALAKSGSSIDTFLAAKFQVEWNSTTSELAPILTPLVQTIDEIENNFEKQYKQETERRENEAQLNSDKAVSGIGYVPNKGIVLLGNRLYDSDTKTIGIDYGKPALTLRIINEFTKADEKAKAATFTISKKSGTDSELGVSGALRLDYYNKKLFDFSDNHSLRPAFGFQWNRSGIDDKREHIKRYYGILDWFWSHGESLWAASQFQIGPVFEQDEKNDIDKITGLIELEPLLRFASFSTAVRMPLLGQEVDTASIYFRPRLALELGEIIDEPSVGKSPNANFFRYGGEIGVGLFQHFELTYTLRQFHGIDGSKEDHTFNEMALDWYLDPNKQYSLRFEYQKGEDSPSFEDVEQYIVGFGITY